MAGDPGASTARGEGSALAMWLRAIRVHQWSKNALLLVPALAAHLRPSAALAVDLFAAILSFSLLASTVYLVNDLIDLEHDRAHPARRRRPLASGRLSPAAAGAAASVLAAGSLVLAAQLPRAFLAAWASYAVLTTAYSFGLKRAVMLDVVILAALYTIRVVAGAAAVDVPLSRWFLAFSAFLFVSLAMLKRMVEIQAATADDRERLAGRGWEVGDRPVLLAFGAGAATAAALVYCLYITGEEVQRLYGRPDVLWIGLPLLLYWIGRAWLLAARGVVHDDPLLFALRDGVSYGVLALMAAVVWVAT